MHETDMSKMQKTSLKTPERNRYFYGKLLDVYHFELEANYFNAKRWLLNRLVSGYGVVCGLDVRLCSDNKSIKVLRNYIDKWEGDHSSGRVGLYKTPRSAPASPTRPTGAVTKTIRACLLCYLECERPSADSGRRLQNSSALCARSD
jgi:hypothetical protein